MNIEAAKLFLEVADAGSLTRVAARRQTVQSHVSRQISDFEAQIGAPLFRRTGRGVALTALGSRTAARLRIWVYETERLAEELRAEAGTVIGEVRLGVIPSAIHPLMTRLFLQLRADHPGIRLSVVEAQGTELNHMVDSGLVDLAVLFRFHHPRASDERLLAVAHTYLVSAPGDGITAGETVPFATLRGLPLVLPRRPSHWRTALDEAAQSRGFELETLAEADSLTMQKELVAHTPGLYTVLGPYSVLADFQSGRLQGSRLVEPELVRHVTLAFPRQGKVSPACRVAAQVIQDLIESWGHRLTEPAA